MTRRYTLLLITMLLAAGVFTAPASAISNLNESFTFGGGYWTLPDIGGGVDDSGFYASASIRSMEYYLEADYAIDDPEFFAIAADYLYPLVEAGFDQGVNAYAGIGYTYMTADALSSESGFNVLFATELSDILWGTARYDFLGSDQQLFTIGISYRMK